MSVMSDIKIRPLERGDLHFVHKINNNDVIMRYWFEEPYGLTTNWSRCDRHHLRPERAALHHRARHRRAGRAGRAGRDRLYPPPRGIPDHHRTQLPGARYAKAATRIAVGYAFRVLNLHKVYLVVDKDNAAAVHIYERCGFRIGAC